MSESGYQGAQDPLSNQGDYNAMTFVISQMIARLNTSTIVKVIAVHDPGGNSLAGTVDVQPQVNQIDGAINPIPHQTIFGLPYLRSQGGANAVVIVPQVGDLGIAIFADRDISKVVSTKKRANPGSLRRFSMADGMYLGGLLNRLPVRYIRIDDVGIQVTSPQGLRISAETYLTGSLNVTGNVTVGSGASGTFLSADGLTITVQDGIITNID
jgi:hypothetical protein